MVSLVSLRFRSPANVNASKSELMSRGIELVSKLSLKSPTLMLPHILGSAPPITSKPHFPNSHKGIVKGQKTMM
eukprot:5907037-Amphidinium_carterae.1